jgi:diguanylate cyclase (GGDEF)-like protein
LPSSSLTEENAISAVVPASAREEQRMPGLRAITSLLVTVVVLFLFSALYISYLIFERQQALRQVSEDNVIWPTSQATTEFARLEQRISAFANPDMGVGPDEIRLRFDIIVNRYNILSSMNLRDFLRSNSADQAIVDDLGNLLKAAQPLIDHIDQPGVGWRLLQLISPMDQKLARLAASANSWGSDRVSEQQSQLIRLHWIFSSIALGLIACGMSLVGLLVWHNRRLQFAHIELHSLTGELTTSSAELASANESLRTQNARFDAALNNMSQALCMVDADQRLIVCNARFLELFSLNSLLAAPGSPIADVAKKAAALIETGRSALSQVLAQQMAPRQSGALGNYSEDLANGRTLAISHQLMAEGGWVATYEDITARRRAEARISHIAHHDSLTELPNRLFFQERLEEAFARLRRYDEGFAILCLDLDRFKVINDTLGHTVGDALLKSVAERLRTSVRATDMVARLGGDEFAIIRLDPHQPSNADDLARRIVSLIGAPYDLNGHRIVISASIGVAVAPTDGASSEQLARNADIALYRAKDLGRGGHRFFEPAMEAQLQVRRRLEVDLRDALEKNQFELFYQPLIDLDTNQVSSCEALIRWQHPDRGMITPAEFIPVAEDIGLIIPLGEWVLKKACQDAASWPKHPKVSVNLSPIQFTDRNLLRAVMEALEASALPPSRLELEITESVLLQSDDSTLATLHELRSRGLSIVMDDFGTGYSSLSYLRSFPFDKIKIDRSFISDLSESADSLVIVKSIVTLARSLGITTTAEGVETAEQVSHLRNMGCNEAQGFYFSRPQRADALTQLLSQHRLSLVDAA